MRLIFTALLLISFCGIQSVHAQSGKNFRRLHVNLGPEIAFPSGDFDKSYNMGVGGSAQLAIPFAMRFFIIGHLGWVSHFGSGNNPLPRRSAHEADWVNLYRCPGRSHHARV
jgi:hypothetical protein